MSPNSKITKYYAGLAALMLVAIGLLLYTVAQGAKAKVDAKTDDALDNISKKLDDYVYKNYKVPASLKDAGVDNVPDSITYNKQDNKTYKICVDYKSAGSGGYDAGWAWWLFGGRGVENEPVDDTLKSDTETSYFDTYTLRYKHKVGQNCQKVTPYISSYTPPPSIGPPSTGSYDSCDSSNNQYYSVKVEATVSKVDDQNGSGTMYFNADGQTITDNKGNKLNNSSPITSKKYDSISYICKDGDKAEASSVTKGQKVTLYSYTLTDAYIVKIDL
jgi:hypothetical protein